MVTYHILLTYTNLLLLLSASTLALMPDHAAAGNFNFSVLREYAAIWKPSELEISLETFFNKNKRVEFL